MDIPGLLYNPVNFDKEMNPGSLYCCARIDWGGARSIKCQVGETQSAFDIPHVAKVSYLIPHRS